MDKKDNKRQYVIRNLRHDEIGLLKDFLYEAIYVPEGVESPASEILELPELKLYIEEFGTRRGDNCLVADFGGKAAGAVWARIMDDYGHVDDETPSIAISLYREYKRSGDRLPDDAGDAGTAEGTGIQKSVSVRTEGKLRGKDV